MNDFLFFIKVVLYTFVAAISLTVLMTWSIVAIDYHLLDYPVKVIDEQHHIIYEGSRACINIESAGASTTVEIGQGYLCLIPKAIYTGKYEVLTLNKDKS